MEIRWMERRRVVQKIPQPVLAYRHPDLRADDVPPRSPGSLIGRHTRKVPHGETLPDPV